MDFEFASERSQSCGKKLSYHAVRFALKEGQPDRRQRWL